MSNNNINNSNMSMSHDSMDSNTSMTKKTGKSPQGVRFMDTTKEEDNMMTKNDNNMNMNDNNMNNNNMNMNMNDNNMTMTMNDNNMNMNSESKNMNNNMNNMNMNMMNNNHNDGGDMEEKGISMMTTQKPFQSGSTRLQIKTRNSDSIDYDHDITAANTAANAASSNNYVWSESVRRPVLPGRESSRRINTKSKVPQPSVRHFTDIVDLDNVSVRAPPGKSLRLKSNNNSGNKYNFRQSVFTQITTSKSFKGQWYYDVETNRKFQAKSVKLLDQKRFRKIDSSGALVKITSDLETGQLPDQVINLNDISVHDYEDNSSEIDLLGIIWRYAFKVFIMMTKDEINGLRLTRGLQLSLPFLTGHEAFILTQVIRAFERKDFDDLYTSLTVAFRNRNVTRVIIRQMPRYDIFWHISTQFKWNWLYDSLGAIPFIGFTGFPPSENFSNTRDFVLGSILRLALGQGYWWTRVITGRQALQTDNKNVIAQNLAAELNGFELANRNQYGAYFGRIKTNHFRVTHRLNIDESVVRTFLVQPLSTILNNGVEHVIGQVARHWHNMLYQMYGNFAHQRQEQLNPFEFLRFHLPVILVVMTTLRGLCKWDSDVLANFVIKIQDIGPVDNVNPILEIVEEFEHHILLPVCGGIASRVKVMRSLMDAVKKALIEIQNQSEAITEMIEPFTDTIGLGMYVIATINWTVPNDTILIKAIREMCFHSKAIPGVCPHAVRRALNLLSPKDKRTLIQLIRSGFKTSHPATLLTQRTVTLLQRELRRDALDIRLRELSKGEEIVIEFKVLSAYWLVEENKSEVYVYYGKSGKDHIFLHRITRTQRILAHDDDIVSIYPYIEVSEELTRAQHIFMTIELEYGKEFTYNAFMEFKHLREKLRSLIVLSQLNSYELDDARLNVLQAIQQSAQNEIHVSELEPYETYYIYRNKKYEPFMCTRPYSPGDPEFDIAAQSKILNIPPQNMIVIGGGPTGLLTTMHCLENVLKSDGKMKLYESRDAYLKFGATFERSQIVRLDSRWIAMLRYHLGTIYEDVFIPATGETDSHYGNVLPAQGFIEITIKDMENMMNVGVVKLVSRGLLTQDTNSGAQYDYKTNQLIKLGKALKQNDLILRKIDEYGKVSEENYTWKIKELIYSKVLKPSELILGEEYSIYITRFKKCYPYRLVGINLLTHMYYFKSIDIDNVPDIESSESSLPSIHPKGTKSHDTCEKIVIESNIPRHDGQYISETLLFNEIEKQPFIIDVGHSHVAEAIGKPHGSPVHFEITTEEPYGVCCLSGLKVSMGMHNFGTRRWKTGIIDDIRSPTDQNTRVIGDFTKTVNSKLITEKMAYFIDNDMNWKMHLQKLVDEMGYKDDLPSIGSLLGAYVHELMKMAPYHRSHLQTRFFETGDNFYLGMEFTREYDRWKKRTLISLTAPLQSSHDKDMKQIKLLTTKIEFLIDRLWYYATLETIRLGDVYNPGGRSQVPHLYLLDSLIPTTLGSLDIGETFTLVSNPNERYEILIKRPPIGIVVRNVEGYTSTMKYDTKVYLGGNLTRGPDGNEESKVSIATFPVGHYVNYRTMRLNNLDKGYVFAFLGDEQSTPHFMRYSGLTGAAINSMLFDQFIRDANLKIPFIERFRDYNSATNWSNGEVVQRGTGNNYGDGFLRPGFQYEKGIDYLYSKVIECIECEHDLEDVLTRDWKLKFAASLIPRGMEFNQDFINALIVKVQDVIFNRFVQGVIEDKSIIMNINMNNNMNMNIDLQNILHTRSNELQLEHDGDNDGWWDDFINGINLPPIIMMRLNSYHILIARTLETILEQLIEISQKQFENNERIGSLAWNQPKSVDCIIDDFAVEGQIFTNSLVQSATLSAAGLGAQLFTPGGSAVPSGIGLFISFGTVTNVSRYKNRNESWRTQFFDEKYLNVAKSIYACLSKHDRMMIPKENNPYYRLFMDKKMTFINMVKYYDYPKPKLFIQMFDDLFSSFYNSNNIMTFMQNITTKLLPDVYHVNSYLQEYLVEIYALAEDLYRVESNLQNDVSSQAHMSALALFERYILFEKRLETSLQRGDIHFGAFQQRALKHSSIAALFQYIWTELWWARTSKGICCTIPNTVEDSRKVASSVIKPIGVETLELAAQMKAVSDIFPSPVLKREINEVESLYYATKESYVSSFIIVAATCSFITGCALTIGNIGLAVNSDALWATRLVSAFTYVQGLAIAPSIAILAVFYLFRKLRLQFDCDIALQKKINAAPDIVTLNRLKNIQTISHTQEFISILRIIASAAAAVALPWSWAARQGFYSRNFVPIFIGLGSFGAQVVATFFIYVFDYFINYPLDPKLGEYICVAFNDELTRIKKDITIPSNSVQTEHVQQRATWEYVAKLFLHKYRFDTFFGANRFSCIFHYIQSGLVLETDSPNISPKSISINQQKANISSDNDDEPDEDPDDENNSDDQMVGH